jgi:hypothetical protein
LDGKQQTLIFKQSINKKKKKKDGEILKCMKRNNFFFEQADKESIASTMKRGSLYALLEEEGFH